MKRTTEEAIERLTDLEKVQLISEFEQFERDGFIGDCMLRKMANDLPGGNAHVTIFMTLLAHECYRYFGNKWLYETDKGMNLQMKV